MSNQRDDSGGGLEDSSSGQLRLYQAVALHVDNLYPYTGKQAFHSVPSPEHPTGTVLAAEDEHSRLARHLEGNIKAGLYTLQSQPSTCIQWRVLSDRRTVELRTLRWIDDGERSDTDASITTSWRFASSVLDTVVVSDTPDGAVSVSVCGTDSVVYTLDFSSPWDIAQATDALSYTSFHRLAHSAEPTHFCGNPDDGALLVACSDASVVWLRRKGSKLVERVCAAGAALIPRVTKFLLGARAGDAQPIAADAGGMGFALAATLGRDRRLRLWTGGACAFDEALPPLHAAADAPPFAPDARALVRVHPLSDSAACVLVYVPDDAAPYFTLLTAERSAGRLAVRTVLRRAWRASQVCARLADAELVDMRVAAAASQDAACTLWALWAGEHTLLTHAQLALPGAHNVASLDRWVVALTPPPMRQPAGGSGEAVLEHVMHAQRFDRGVVRLAAALHGQRTGGPLRQLVVDSVAAADTRDSWTRFSALCERLQRAADAPVGLALGAQAHMVCVVGRNTLAPVHVAAEPECLSALGSGDPAAGVLLSAPASWLACYYPVLAQARGLVAGVLAAAAALRGALGCTAAAKAAESLALDACQDALVSLEARAAELYDMHCASLSQRQRKLVTRQLARLDDPLAAVRLVLHALVQPSHHPLAAEGLCASATMAGVYVAGFAAAAEARFSLACDFALLVMFAACAGALHGDVAGALAACRRAVRLYAVPRWLAAQPTGADCLVDASPANDGDEDDGFLHRFSVMNIARPGAAQNTACQAAEDDPACCSAEQSQFTYSVVHDTLARGSPLGVRDRAGAFGDMVGDGVAQVFDNVSGVVFAALVERSQPAVLADALLRRLPKSPGASYVAARATLRLLDHPLAADRFAAAAAAAAAAFTAGDEEFAAVLPAGVACQAAAYYEHVAELFAACRAHTQAARFAHLALQALDTQGSPDDTVGPRKRALWLSVFRAETALCAFDAAFLAVTAQPDPMAQADCLRHLVTLLCEQPGGAAELCRLPFGALLPEVERTLLFKARHSDVSLDTAPDYYRVLYALHIYRANHRAAAAAIYQCARRLHTRMRVAGDVSRLLGRRANALLACIAALRQVDGAQGWVVVARTSAPASAELGEEETQAKRRRLAAGRHDAVDVVALSDVRRELALVQARIALSGTFGELLARDVLFEPQDALALYVKSAQYDDARRFVKQMGLSLAPVVTALARTCIRLSSPSSSSAGECVPEAFWRTKGLSEAGAPGERAWRVVQSWLQEEEPCGLAEHLPLRLLVADELLRADLMLPPWLADPLVRCCAQDLVRTCLRLGCVTEGAEFLLTHVRSLTRLASQRVLPSRAFCLPYGLVDQTVGILRDAVDRFERAVARIREDGGEARVLKSYGDRLHGLRRLLRDLPAAVDCFVELAAAAPGDAASTLTAPSAGGSIEVN